MKKSAQLCRLNNQHLLYQNEFNLFMNHNFQDKIRKRTKSSLSWTSKQWINMTNNKILLSIVLFFYSLELIAFLIFRNLKGSQFSGNNFFVTRDLPKKILQKYFCFKCSNVNVSTLVIRIYTPSRYILEISWAQKTLNQSIMLA